MFQSVATFRRSLRIPDGIDIEKIEASCKSGILTVKLPKSSEAQKNQKTIPISEVEIRWSHLIEYFWAGL